MVFIALLTFSQALLCACENSGRGEDPFPSSMKTYTEEDTEKINKKSEISFLTFSLGRRLVRFVSRV